jgi:cation-transporting ATPase V
MTLRAVLPGPGIGPEALLATAAAAEAPSEHPIAAALLAAACERELTVEAASDFRAVAGHGVSARVGGRAVLVGRRALLRERRIAIPAELETRASGAEARGETVVFVAHDGAAVGAIAVGDTVKPGARELVAALHARGIEVAMLTGDNARAAHAVADRLAIDHVIAEVLPEDKVAEVARLQESGRVVAMVGDGINDAAALVQADLGIAIGTGTDIAIEASDITLVSGRLDGVLTALTLARSTLRTIRQNLAWAFAYNLAAIPVAAFGVLPPIAAGATMAASSVSVVGNSLRLFHLVHGSAGVDQPRGLRAEAPRRGE